MEPKFEKPIIRKDYEALSTEIQEHKDGVVEILPSDKELVRAVIGKRIQDDRGVNQQSSGNQSLPKYLDESTEDIQSTVRNLIGIALEKGIDESIKEAKKYGPFILDALHDALTAKVYNDLKSKGKLK
ncbi:hypothetical protein GW950_02110 [Candidatus Wolfebacteria bacterium]|nr:hypothetical protein [Candidatus Wolfebacteria bacterium]